MVLLAFLFFVPSAAARITTGEARWAARYASEEGPWTTIQRHGQNLIELRAAETESRQWTADCPFETNCGPCEWEQTDTRDLQVWVRKLRNGYRVRDNLGWAYVVPVR